MYRYLFVKYFFPLYERYLARRKTAEFISYYSANSGKERVEIEGIQLEALKKLLKHAYENCAFYREQWDQIGFDYARVTSIKDLSSLPVLDKNTIRENYSKIVSDKFRGKNFVKSTGGSSGTPFKLELNAESNQRRQAVMWRGYGRLGAGLGVKTLYLWGGNITPVGFLAEIKENLYHRFYNRKMLNSFLLKDSNILSYISEINKFKPKAIVSYVNPLVLLSDYIIKNNINVHTPGSILTGAEPLYEFQRKTIEEAFKAPVYNTYGCREFMLIGSECINQEGLHINSDHLVVEIVDEDGNQTDSGSLAITDLHNFGFPLIRYLNGDQATKADTEFCSCGSPFPMLKSVDGRKLDVIKTPDGRSIPGEFFPHLFKDFSNVSKFQIIQHTLDTLDVTISFYDKEQLDELERVKSLISKAVGDTVSLTISLVDEIPVNASGKHRVTISKL